METDFWPCTICRDKPPEIRKNFFLSNNRLQVVTQVPEKMKMEEKGKRLEELRDRKSLGKYYREVIPVAL